MPLPVSLQELIKERRCKNCIIAFYFNSFRDIVDFRFIDDMQKNDDILS